MAQPLCVLITNHQEEDSGSVQIRGPKQVKPPMPGKAPCSIGLSPLLLLRMGSQKRKCGIGENDSWIWWVIFVGQSIIFKLANQINTYEHASTKFLKYFKFDYNKPLLNTIACICFHSCHYISGFCKRWNTIYVEHVGSTSQFSEYKSNTCFTPFGTDLNLCFPLTENASNLRNDQKINTNLQK